MKTYTDWSSISKEANVKAYGALEYLEIIADLAKRWHSLNLEQKEAERALARDPSEKNYQWLQNVKRRMEWVRDQMKAA